MSLADIADNIAEIRDAYQENFMGDRCSIWLCSTYLMDNDGTDADYGQAAAYSAVPCKLRRPDGRKLEEGGLIDLAGDLVLPIAYLDLVDARARIEITTLQADVLPASLLLSIREQPRPETTGLACKVELVTGGSTSNE